MMRGAKVAFALLPALVALGFFGIVPVDSGAELLLAYILVFCVMCVSLGGATTVWAGGR
jgi:hypothetical protein